MTWPVTLGLSAVLLIATAALRSEVPTLVICKDCLALAPAEEVREIQEGHGPILAPPFGTMADEDASSP
jgi:hypothetical protein